MNSNNETGDANFARVLQEYLRKFSAAAEDNKDNRQKRIMRREKVRKNNDKIRKYSYQRPFVGM
jgi:hypothetical protein